MEQPIEFKHLGNPPGKDLRGEYASKWVFPGNVQMPKHLYPYSTQARKGMQNPQGKGWQTQKPRTLPSSARQIYGKFSAKNIPHLILQRYWSRETRQQNICQNMGETYMLKGTCACIIFCKNS